ncbi:MAG: hypothetical protein WC794_00775 [Candidatus Doudnabacteria bacterium]|jgi:hypothetical protein
MKPKYWAIILLGAVAICVSALYFAKQPAQDYGPIVINHKAVKSPTPANETNNWKTYSNSEYGFEFEYPSTLNKYSDSNSLIILQSTPKQLVLGDPARIKGVDGVDFYTDGYEFIFNILDKTEFDRSIKTSTYDITKLYFPNIQATRYDETGAITFGPVVAITNLPDKMITASYAEQCDKTCNLEDVDKIFNKILLTFKFTQPTTKANEWNTYKNNEFGFTFEYPESWFIEYSNNTAFISNQSFEKNWSAINLKPSQYIVSFDSKIPIDPNEAAQVGINEVIAKDIDKYYGKLGATSVEVNLLNLKGYHAIRFEFMVKNTKSLSYAVPYSLNDYLLFSILGDINSINNDVNLIVNKIISTYKLEMDYDICLKQGGEKGINSEAAYCKINNQYYYLSVPAGTLN